MERLKLQMPPSYNFTTELQVRITDINYGGHVGNDVFLSYIHEARLQYLQSFGFSELNVAGYSLIMADAALEFKAELRHKDKLLCHVVATNFNKLGFNIFYKLEVLRNDKYVVAAFAKTSMLGFDYTSGKKSSFPEGFEKHFFR